MSLLAFIAIIFGIIAVCFTAVCITCIIKAPDKFVGRDDDDDNDDEGEEWKNPKPAPGRTFNPQPSEN